MMRDDSSYWVDEKKHQTIICFIKSVAFCHEDQSSKINSFRKKLQDPNGVDWAAIP